MKLNHFSHWPFCRYMFQDFGKHAYMRRFVQDYIRVLYAHNDGPDAVRSFVQM